MQSWHLAPQCLQQHQTYQLNREGYVSSPAYYHIDAIFLVEQHLPSRGGLAEASNAKKARDLLFLCCLGACTPPALWGVTAQLLLLLSAGSQAHVQSLEMQLGQHAQGWEEDKSQMHGILLFSIC